MSPDTSSSGPPVPITGTRPDHRPAQRRLGHGDPRRDHGDPRCRHAQLGDQTGRQVRADRHHLTTPPPAQPQSSPQRPEVGHRLDVRQPRRFRKDQSRLAHLVVDRHAPGPAVAAVSPDQSERAAHPLIQRLPSAGISKQRGSSARTFPRERHTTWRRQPRRSRRSSHGARGHRASYRLRRPARIRIFRSPAAMSPVPRRRPGSPLGSDPARFARRPVRPSPGPSGRWNRCVLGLYYVVSATRCLVQTHRSSSATHECNPDHRDPRHRPSTSCSP